MSRQPLVGGPVLVINSGSSSLKYQLVVPVDGEVLASGLIERIGEVSGRATHTSSGRSHTIESAVVDHGAALRVLHDQFAEHGPDLDQAGVVAVGHRVVHGGPDFSTPVIIDDAVESEIDALSPLAPLHNPAAVAGIRAARARFGVPHVAVFDTAFFTGLPSEAKTYAIPAELAVRHKIRRYGFHGTSHAYVAGRAAEVLERPAVGLNLVIFHLGNGASVSAVTDGRAIETSMGLTPLQGLVMGTRSGDIDPSIYPFLRDAAAMSIADTDTMLNHRSGVKGLSGVNDFRLLEDRMTEDPAARLAFDVYIHRLRHYLGAYAFLLGRLDAVVFTAGVGENSPMVRAAALAELTEFGIRLDPDRNAPRSKDPRIISTDDSGVTVLVVPTNEELSIARQAQQLVG
ncbi:MAG: acetate kinase [Microlunatus sp.]|nr:acetate kinase [Microlunatus sp.]MDN5769992.1 acetate kinase [Microlunatus sp.]MDN5804330.1 acetate kinase [Microlunatus sp.]